MFYLMNGKVDSHASCMFHVTEDRRKDIRFRPIHPTPLLKQVMQLQLFH